MSKEIRAKHVLTHYQDGYGADRTVRVVEVSDGRARCEVISDRSDRMVGQELVITVARLSRRDWLRTA